MLLCNTCVRLEAEKELSQQLQQEVQSAQEKRTRLKTSVAEVTAELDRLRRENQQLKANWQEKGLLVDGMEAQIKSLRDSYSAKEQKLRVACEQASSKAQEAQVLADQEVDRASKRLQAAEEQAKQLQVRLRGSESARADAEARVVACENEMRELLQEMERMKRQHHEKQRRLAAVLQDMQGA